MLNIILSPRSCGFTKVGAFNVTKTRTGIEKGSREGTAKFKARTYLEQYQDFKDIFKYREDAFYIDYKDFLKKIPELKTTFLKWREKA